MGPNILQYMGNGNVINLTGNINNLTLCFLVTYSIMHVNDCDYYLVKYIELV